MMPFSGLIAVSKAEVLDILWTRLPMLVADISPQVEEATGVAGPVFASGRILYANVAAEHLFGYEMVGSMRGKAVEDLIPSDVRQRHADHVTGYARLPGHREMGLRDMQLLALRADGTTFPVAIELIPAMIQGTPCVICVAADMSGRTRPHGYRG